VLLADLLTYLVHPLHDIGMSFLMARYAVILVIFLDLKLSWNRSTEWTSYHTTSCTLMHCLCHSDHLQNFWWNTALILVVIFIMLVFVEWDSLSHHDSTHWTIHFDNFFFSFLFFRLLSLSNLTRHLLHHVLHHGLH